MRSAPTLFGAHFTQNVFGQRPHEGLPFVRLIDRRRDRQRSATTALGDLITQLVTVLRRLATSAGGMPSRRGIHCESLKWVTRTGHEGCPLSAAFAHGQRSGSTFLNDQPFALTATS